MSNRLFAGKYAEATGKRIDAKTLRVGQLRPSYQFIEDVADHGLLSLSDASRPGGDQRAALFAVAGLIEVTPESTCQWNHDVLANWQHRREQHPASSQPTWNELMHKLLDFQTQGWRWRSEDIATVANTQGKTGGTLDASRVAQLLSGGGVPTQVERTALAEAAGLTPAQSAAIESAVENKTLLLGKKPSPSAAFWPSLNQFREHGRSGSPSGRQRPRPCRAKSISRDSNANISSVVAIGRPVISLRMSGRLLISCVTPLTVTAPIPRFNASVTSFRSGTTASRTKLCSMA